MAEIILSVLIVLLLFAQFALLFHECASCNNIFYITKEDAIEILKESGDISIHITGNRHDRL